MIKFFVHGIPKPKARARTVRNKKTGNVHSFTPDTTATWEQSVLVQALEHKPDQPWNEPLGVGLIFNLIRPTSISKKRKWPSVKPDLDNLSKSVLDALNGVYYTDDSRICEMVIRKRYSQTPGVEVTIWKIDNPPEVKIG
jgi:Holliday junction resolvase RusA-like endonuclease